MNRIIYKEGSDKLLYICISFTLIYVVMKKIIIAIDGVSSTGEEHDGKKIWQGSWDIPISIQGQCTGLSLCTVCSTVSLQAVVSMNRSCRMP